MRAFIGVPIDISLIPRIIEIQKKFNVFADSVKFVESENLHFTIKFLGNITPEIYKNIKLILHKKLSGKNGFEISLKGLGVFPSLNYIKVLWIGVENGREKLISLMEKVDDIISSLGIAKENSYIPHLTILRVKKKLPREHFVNIFNEIKDIEIGKMTVSKLIFYQSILKPTGPIYTPLYELPLEVGE